MFSLCLQLTLSLLVLNLLPRVIRWAGPRYGAICASFPVVGGTLLLLLSDGKTQEELERQVHTSLAGLTASAVCALLFGTLLRFTTLRLWCPIIASLAFIPLAEFFGEILPSNVADGLIVAGTITLALGLAFAGQDRAETKPHSLSTVVVSPWIRQLVPATFVIASSLVRSHLSAEYSGLLSSFPLMSLLTFTLTLKEEGSRSAELLTYTYPLGNLAAVVFYGIYALITPGHSAATGAVMAVLTSIPCSAVSGWFIRSQFLSTQKATTPSRALQHSTCLGAL